MSTADNTNIHRWLDEAFAGIVMTPDLQDLKEELRGNLAARLSELIAGGTDAATAATLAIDELGDIRELIFEVDGPALSAAAGAQWSAAARTPQPAAGGAARGSTYAPPTAASVNEAYRVHRVRPKPAFVVGVVISAIAGIAGVLLAALGAVGLLGLPTGVIVLASGIAATGVAWIVGLSLTQETTTNHPMPGNRAGGYFWATLLAVFGLEIGGLIALGTLAAWVSALAALSVVAAIVLFAFLGATQTNRKKSWARDLARQYQADDRFSQDPVAAARFGIYTVVIWIVAFASFVVLSMTIGFAWSWLALLAGFAVFFLVLARMLFPAQRHQTAHPNTNTNATDDATRKDDRP